MSKTRKLAADLFEPTFEFEEIEIDRAAEQRQLTLKINTMTVLEHQTYAAKFAQGAVNGVTFKVTANGKITITLLHESHLSQSTLDELKNAMASLCKSPNLSLRDKDGIQNGFQAYAHRHSLIDAPPKRSRQSFAPSRHGNSAF